MPQQLPLDETSSQKVWKPKAARISDEAVVAMSMAQLGDWVAQQEKAAKVSVPAELSLDQLSDRILECCSDQRMSRFI